MTFVLVAGTEKMSIVRMVLVVKRLIALVWDLEQHSYNMARDRETTWILIVIVEIKSWAEQLHHID